MKKYVVMAVLFALAIGFYAGCYYVEKYVDNRYYPNSGYILYADYDNDLLLIEDTSGMKWLYEGVEDWMDGDRCSMIMDNKGTENIKDDDIIKIRYEGWGE